MQTEADFQRIRDREDNRKLDTKYDDSELRAAEDKLESDVLYYISEHRNDPALELLQSMQNKFDLSADRVGKFISMWYAEV